MNKKLNILFIAITGILGTAPLVHAQIYSSCDRWASYTQGDWTIYNNVWGNRRPGTQCLYVNSINSWYVNTKQDRGGVKSYPNTSVIPNTPLAQMRSATGDVQHFFARQHQRVLVELDIRHLVCELGR